MTRKRRRFSSEEKVKILRRHLLDHIPVSDVCSQTGISPTIFYRWQKEFFEHGAAAFDKKSGKREKKLEEKVSKLQEKISDKDEVIAEIMEAHIQLKKNLGEL
jgi:transposase-like protein